MPPHHLQLWGFFLSFFFRGYLFVSEDTDKKRVNATKTSLIKIIPKYPPSVLIAFSWFAPTHRMMMVSTFLFPAWTSLLQSRLGLMQTPYRHSHSAWPNLDPFFPPLPNTTLFFLSKTLPFFEIYGFYALAFISIAMVPLIKRICSGAHIIVQHFFFKNFLIGGRSTSYTHM